MQRVLSDILENPDLTVEEALYYDDDVIYEYNSCMRHY